MRFRSEWTPRSLTLSKLQEIEQAICAIEALLSDGASEAADEQIGVLNETYGRNEEADLFQNYEDSMSRTELALRLSQPEPRPSQHVTRAELIELVRRIQDPDYAISALVAPLVVNDIEQSESAQSEVSSADQAAFLQEYYLDLLTVNVSLPGISDLIFWDDLEAEDIVDRALAYQPIILPPT
ncbi:hypothetical protein [Saccharibacillus sacchari]|uniref:hypothetical protein n=1 Tax=Saccharibacillus sacchari TaxID=456493 RepID=UPI0004BC0230|nr:hypothetical protein [Saccharibacillus sacchari]